MQLSELQAGLIARLSTIDGLTVAKWESPVVVVPMAVVRPSRIDYNATMGRGTDDVEFSISLLVSRADAESGLDELNEFAAGHGARSIRTVAETSTGASDVLNACMVRVDDADISVAVAGDAEYLQATFSVATTIDGA